MEKILDWMFNTKAGRFVFILVFDVIVFTILVSTTSLHFIPMMIGGTAAAIPLSIFDGNKRWY